MKRKINEVFIAFKIILLDGLRNPLNTITMLVFYGFFYLIGYFLYGFATNELEIFQKYLISGFIATSFLFQATGWWSFIFAELKYYGQLEETILSYSNIEVYIVGAFLYATIVTFVSILVALVAIYFLFGFPFFYLRWQALIVILIFAILAYFFSLVSNAFFIFFKEYWALSNIISSLIIVITPIFYPLNFLPPFFQFVAKLFPLTWGVELLRSILYDINNFNYNQMWFYFIVTAIGWAVFAFFLWRKAYKNGKKTGEIYSL
ncbi:MAG: ABC transporter permease [Planctomycetota bacterium]